MRDMGGLIGGLAAKGKSAIIQIKFDESELPL